MSLASTLRRLRADLGASQEDIAEASNVVPKEYKRYEAGMTSVPGDAYQQLAAGLHTTVDVLVGITRYSCVALSEGTALPNQVYWGEVAVHFDGGSEPILVSISKEAVREFRSEIAQGKSSVVVLDGMCNERYVIRRDAIAEVILSAEESDEFGVNGFTYEDFYAIPIIDHRLWDVFTAIHDDDCRDYENFSRGEMAVALSHYMTAQEIEDYLVNCEFGRTESSELLEADLKYRHLLTQFGVACAGEAEFLSDEERAQRKSFILDRAIGVKFAMKGGTTRKYVLEHAEKMNSIYESMFQITPSAGRFIDVGTVNAQGTLLPLDKIDYVRFPTHQLERSAAGYSLER